MLGCVNPDVEGLNAILVFIGILVFIDSLPTSILILTVDISFISYFVGLFRFILLKLRGFRSLEQFANLFQLLFI